MRLPWTLFLSILLASCSHKYTRLARNYQLKTPVESPAYENLDYWAAHPFKWDPSDSVPAPLRNEMRDSVIDVFFVHPTTYTKGKNRGNARLDNAYLNAKTDYSTILYQASVFNQHARVFAPRYRQVHILNFFEKDSTIARPRFEKAYADVKAAFNYYLNHWNKGRPFIIASHSQGSLMAERLYEEVIKGKSTENQMVAAYFIGWPISPQFISADKICKDSLDIKCLCGWRTLRDGFIPWYLKNDKGSYVTNPLSWTTTGESISRKANKGSVLRDFNRIYPSTTDARVAKGFLFVHKPRFPFSFLYFRRNYHIADINLFYINLRENISQRIRQFTISRGTDGSQ